MGLLFDFFLLVFLFVYLVRSGMHGDRTDSTLLEVPGLGVLRGKMGKSYFTGRPVYHFLGINYAKAPSGERRFKPPEEFGGWRGVYEATKMRQRCPQVDLPYYPTPDPGSLDLRSDQEDCLVVNVFTPSVDGGVKMPVMFYIHGGSFYLGSAYDFLPDFLLEEDIVLVVAQYRLGPLGFLALNTTEIPGNMGMLDILLALRWVKAHIRHFGGDPAKVTVCGQSAGGAAASALLISPSAEKGLFERMIVQSGSVLGSWVVDGNPLLSARKIAETIGCPAKDIDEMTRCFKQATASDLIEGHFRYLKEDIASGGSGVGGSSLVVQDAVAASTKFLDRHPREAFEAGLHTDVPVLGGTARDEGSSFLTAFYDVQQLRTLADGKYLQRNITKDIIRFFGHEDPAGLLTDVYHNSYFRAGRTETLEEMLPGLISGVLVIKASTYDLLRTMSRRSTTYAYSFNFYGNVSKLRASEPDWHLRYPFPTGVAHSDELGYIFPSVRSEYSPRELDMVRTLTSFWTNFIISGSPVASEEEDKWPAVSTPYGPYLRLADASKVRANFYEEFAAATNEGFPPAE